ncbi:hypothetical protein YC2023_100081 [Brassica napus]
MEDLPVERGEYPVDFMSRNSWGRVTLQKWRIGLDSSSLINVNTAQMKTQIHGPRILDDMDK